ncbi:MAG: carbohydrate ABC transporter permease, partial [Spirochaetales bacterium]
MRIAKIGRLSVEVFTLLLFILFLFPFFLVLINSA